MNSVHEQRASVNRACQIAAKIHFKLAPPLQVTYVSPDIEALLGYTVDHFYKNSVNIRSRFHLDDREIADQIFLYPNLKYQSL